MLLKDLIDIVLILKIDIAIGIGISGSLVTVRLQKSIQTLISPDIYDKINPSFSARLQ